MDVYSFSTVTAIAYREKVEFEQKNPGGGSVHHVLRASVSVWESSDGARLFDSLLQVLTRKGIANFIFRSLYTKNV